MELLEAIRYVADKRGSRIDSPMAEMLEDIHHRVSSHIQNENEDTPNDTVAAIDMIQNILGGIDGRTDDSGDT
jgi:hypothetical protein